MANRFERLFQLPANQYIEGAPIILAAGALLKDNESGSIVVQLKFQSVAEKRIKAVKISLSAYDVSETEVQGVNDYQYLEMDIANGQKFGFNKAIVMPVSVTRSFAVSSVIVVFKDGSMWQNATLFTELAEEKLLDFGNPELEKQYRIETNDNAKYFPQEDKGLWRCACGVWNSEIACTHCCNDKNCVFAALDAAYLTEKMNNRLALEVEQRKNAAEEREKRIKRNKKIAIITPIAVVLIIVAIIVLSEFISLNGQYREARKLMNEGEYSAAIEAFEEIKPYKDSENKILECEIAILDSCYNNALDLMNGQKYEEAITAFDEIKSYKDSAIKIQECNMAILDTKYKVALALMNEGRYEEAIPAFADIIEHKNSQQLYKKIIVQLYGKNLYDMQGLWHTKEVGRGPCDMIRIVGTNVYTKSHESKSYIEKTAAGYAYEWTSNMLVQDSGVVYILKYENDTIVFTTYINDAVYDQETYYRTDIEILKTCP